MTNSKLSFRLIWHIFGAVLIAFGVQTIVYSHIGSAPLDATVYYLTRIGLQIFAGGNFAKLYSLMGVASLIFGTFITLILLIIKPSKILIFTWVNIFIVALFIFLWGFLFDKVLPPLLNTKYIYRVLVGIGGLFPLSIGVFITLISGLPAGPHEELQKLYETKVNNIFFARLIVEVTYLVLAFILMIISVVIIDKGKLDFTQVGWYTLTVTVGASVLIYVYNLIYQRILKKFSKEDVEDESESIH